MDEQQVRPVRVPITRTPSIARLVRVIKDDGQAISWQNWAAQARATREVQING